MDKSVVTQQGTYLDLLLSHFDIIHNWLDGYQKVSSLCVLDSTRTFKLLYVNQQNGSRVLGGSVSPFHTGTQYIQTISDMLTLGRVSLSMDMTNNLHERSHKAVQDSKY